MNEDDIIKIIRDLKKKYGWQIGESMIALIAIAIVKEQYKGGG